MRKVPLVLGLVLVMTGTAMAAQPLTDNQMNGVTAGYTGPDPGGPNEPLPPGTILPPFITLCGIPLDCGPPQPPPNAPPSVQFSYISYFLTLSGVVFQVPLVRP